MRPVTFLFCTMILATFAGCSMRDPIVFVAWPAEARYVWDNGGTAVGFAMDDARARLGAARAVAGVRATASAISAAPATAVTTAPMAAVVDGSGESVLVDLNTASPAELDLLPRIGPAMAQRIVDARPFRRVEDLRRVSGIGDATYRAIADLVTVSGP